MTWWEDIEISLVSEGCDAPQDSSLRRFSSCISMCVVVSILPSTAAFSIYS